MGIPLSSNFDVNAQIPLESKRVQNTLADRDNIPTIQRYEGLEVYVRETGSFYTLVGGISNSNWQIRSSSGNVSSVYDPSFTHKRIETDANGNILINGNIIINGSSYETHTEQLYTKKDEIILRDGATSGLGSGVTGIRAKLYDGINDGRLIFDANGVAKVGDVGDEQPLTTRIDNPINGQFAYWDSANNRLNFKYLGISDVHNLQNILDGKAALSHSHVKTDITDFAHTHAISEVSGLQTALDGKLNTSEVVTSPTANRVLRLDANSKLPASITGNADGNAATATRLQTARTINGIVFDGTSGIITSFWGASRTLTIGNTGKSVNGSANVTWTLSEIGAAALSHTHVVADVSNLQTLLDAKLDASEVVTTPTANKVLRLDANSKLPASITGNADGNATTATRLATARTLTIGSTGKTFDGSANISWTLGEIGAASSVHSHAIADITNLQTSLDAKFNASEVVSTPTANRVLRLDASGLLPTGITGNAATATRLQTSRTINGTGFDGTSGIVTSFWGTARTLTIGNTGKSVNGSGDVSWSLAEIGAAAASHTHTDYTPYSSRSQTVPAYTHKMIRIATTNLGVGLNDATFEIHCSYASGGSMGRVSFTASNHNNNPDSVRITKRHVSFSNSNILTISYARVLYLPNVSANQYGYLDVWVNNPHPQAVTITTTMINGIGWILTTGEADAPPGYVEKGLSLYVSAPYYSTNERRSVVLPNNGVLNLNHGFEHNNVVATISQNTTINMLLLPDGYMGSVLLNVTTTSTITIGSITSETGTNYIKHLSGSLNNLPAGWYMLTYRSIPDANGTLRVFFAISSNFITI